MLVGLFTQWAFVRSRIIVPLDMDAMRSLVNELLSAYVAGIVVFFRMYGHMSFVQGLGPETSLAKRAFIDGVQTVGGEMCL